MKAGRVVVVGSFMMDLVVCAAARPRAGETVVGTDFAMFLGGKGFNQAVAAARAGARTSMVGRVGDDEFGHRFVDQLASDGIDTAHVRVDASLGTGVGAPVLDRTGDNSIVVIPRANAAMTPSDVESAASDIARADVVVLQLELPVEVSLAAARLARSSGATVVLNPSPLPPNSVVDEFRGLVDVLIVNEVEAADLCGPMLDEPALRRLARRIDADLVVTRGPDGCQVVHAESIDAIRGHVVDVVDTVGAGDAFCGVLAACLSGGLSLSQAAEYGNAAGALAVTRRGAEPAMPREFEIRQMMDPSRRDDALFTPRR